MDDIGVTQINSKVPDMCQGLNSQDFAIIGDGHQPNSVGVYIPIIRIPVIKGGMSKLPNIRSGSTLAHMLNSCFLRLLRSQTLKVNRPIRCKYLGIQFFFGTIIPHGSHWRLSRRFVFVSRSLGNVFLLSTSDKIDLDLGKTTSFREVW